LEEAVSLKALLEDSTVPNEETLINAFINDFKSLLKIESAYDLIEDLFSIERNVELIREKFPDFINHDLDGFYRDLAPVILQKFWERKRNPLQEETVDQLFLESIHIAIEEEIQIWQEKIQ
jgi:hypothetical protein